MLLASQIQTWPISRFRPYDRNPRKNDHAVERVAAAIREFGFRVPVIAKSSGELVDGHLRLKAAAFLKLETIPVLLADDLTDAQVRAFRISVNRMAELAEWDTDLLAAELDELAELDVPAELAGWTGAELEELDVPVAAAEVLADPEEVPEVKPVVTTRPGDLWLLGGHRLLCGDSTKAENVARVAGGALTPTVLFDPPWDIHVAPLRGTIATLVFSDGRRSADVVREFGAPTWLFTWDCVSSWYTPNRPLQRAKYAFWYGDLARYDFDGAHYGDAGDTRIVANSRGSYAFQPDPRGKHLSDVFAAPITRLHAAGEHPHEKPLDWVRLLLGNCTTGAILDPFLGSGTTLIAAEQLGRRCHGLELEPRYCDVIVRRWEGVTGKQATLEATGETFAAVAANRNR